MEKQVRFCSEIKDRDANLKHSATVYSFCVLRVIFLENSNNETKSHE